MASDFLSLITAIPSLMQAFGGGTSAPYQKQQEQLAQQQNQISQALLQGPNNPLYQQMYGQYQQQGQQQLAQGIAQLQAQNRLNTGMGRTPLFNQERGGEQIFRNLMQGYQGLGTQADQQTRQNLTQAMQGTGQGLNAYNQISPYAKASNSAQLSGFNTIYNLMNGSYGKQPQMSSGQQPQVSSGYMGTGSFNPFQQMQPTGAMGAGNYTQQYNQPQMMPAQGYSY